MFRFIFIGVEYPFCHISECVFHRMNGRVLIGSAPPSISSIPTLVTSAQGTKRKAEEDDSAVDAILQSSFIRSNDPFTSWAYMSQREMIRAFRAFPWRSRVRLVLSRTFPDLKDGHAAVSFVEDGLGNAHYIVTYNNRDSIVYFDPLGRPFHETMLGLPAGAPHVVDLLTEIQPMTTPYCGPYCLFFLAVVMTELSPCRTHIPNVRAWIRHHLHRYMFFGDLGENTFPNDSLAEIFVVDHKLGEEFHEPFKYVKIHNYLKSAVKRAYPAKKTAKRTRASPS